MKWEPLFINGRDSGTCPGLFRARMWTQVDLVCVCPCQSTDALHACTYTHSLPLSLTFLALLHMWLQLKYNFSMWIKILWIVAEDISWVLMF
jgi:hypothetical protein